MAHELDHLNDDFIAFGKAGLDKNFTLFKIYTRKIQDTKTGEVGIFEFKCAYDLVTFEQAHDPVGLLKNICRRYVAHAIKETGAPVEMWIIEFSPIMEKYNIPSHLFFDTARDRNWLL